MNQRGRSRSRGSCAQGRCLL